MNGASCQWLDCLNRCSELSGETNQEFTTKFNREFALAISTKGYTDRSTCYLINDAGLGSISKDVIRVFPNPENGKFTVLLKSDYSENVVFYLSNSIG